MATQTWRPANQVASLAEQVHEMNAPPIEVRDLNKRYKNGTWGNRDLSLTVEHGELLSILGPNGAGKTTLVRQVTTELVPTSGEVRIFGVDGVSHPNEAKGYMGVMPQEANLFWGLSAWHHLRIFGKLRGLPPKMASRRAEELISELGLAVHRDKASQELSGGLRRRLLVGIASVSKPPLLILDEPSVGLDPESRHNLWDLLRSYKRRGSTVLLTTHYMEEAEMLSDRVGIIHDGTLVALDTVDNLKAAHGYKFKIAMESGDRTETIYGSDPRMLAQQALDRGIHQYAVSPTTLEDAYLALTGERARLDERANG